MKYYMTVIKLGSAGVVAPIELFVSEGEADPEAHRLGVRMDLSDFVQGLAAEVGNPAMLLTQAALLAKLQQATNTVVGKMKTETIRIV